MTWDEWTGLSLRGLPVVVAAGVKSAPPFESVNETEKHGHIEHSFFDLGQVAVRFANGDLDSYPYEDVLIAWRFKT